MIMAQDTKSKATSIMGKKRGMVQIFDEKGAACVCTVIHAEPNVITQIKTRENDGYTAIQLGFDTIKVNDERTIAKRCSKPLLGHYRKAEVAPRRHLWEERLDEVSEYQVGQEVSVGIFSDVRFLDATATSIGKGYQGVMKKHGMAGGPASHGSSLFHRKMGSTGSRSTPGRCLPGGKRASHMGDIQVTIQNLEVVAIDEQKNLVFVKGAVPGANDSVVLLRKAIKKHGKKRH